MDPDLCDRIEHVMELRHSSRGAFDPAWRVSERELARILDAARWAPTAHDMQNFRLVVVDDPSMLARLGADTVAGAPLVVVVLWEPNAPDVEPLGTISLGCVMENMWLVAHAEHLDVQVVSAVAREAEAEVRRALGVPAPWRVAYAMRFGHALEPRIPRRARRPLDAFVGRNRF